MEKIRLGGIKILEGRSYAGWSCDKAGNTLPDICIHMEQSKITE